jgi:hypothetical protein
MTQTTDTRSFWQSLMKSVLVITTVSSGASVAAPDLRADEPVRLSGDCTATVEVKAVARGSVMASSIETRTVGEAGSPYPQSQEAAAIQSADEPTPYDDPEFRMPRNAFGVGSFAISALGFSTLR